MLLSRFNLTDKEGSADRKVPIQPLVFHSKDGKVSRYNLRKVHTYCYLMMSVHILKCHAKKCF
jgi:hypothetical protein